MVETKSEEGEGASVIVLIAFRRTESDLTVCVVISSLVP